METHIAHQKVFFTTIVLILLMTIVIGIHYVRSSQTFTFANTQRAVAYPFYVTKVQLLGEDNFLKKLYAVFGQEYERAETVTENSRAQDIPVLVYHGLTDTPDRFNMTPAVFEDHMFSLHDAGYRTVTLQEFKAFLDGERNLAQNSIVITFDDGRTDSYYQSDAILRALDFTAVMFIPTLKTVEEVTKQRFYLTEAELARMVDSGRWELGSHAVQMTGGQVSVNMSGTKENFLSHRAWNGEENRLETFEEYEARIEDELVRSKYVIERAFGTPVLAFSYPFGDYGQHGDAAASAKETIQTIIADTYDLAFRQVWPYDTEHTSNYPDMPHNTLRRIEPSPTWSGAELVTAVTNARAKMFPYIDSFEDAEGWKETWGDTRLRAEGDYEVFATTETTGALTFLDGSYPWTDYAYTVTGTWDTGSHVSLLARFVDGENYLMCTFGPDSVRLEEREAATGTIHAEIAAPDIGPGGVTLSMRVLGDTVQCTKDGVVYIDGIVGNRLTHGGIGLRVWDEVPGVASFRIHTVAVDPPDIP